MRDPSLSPSSRLGGAVISDRIVSALLEELRTGRYAQADRLPAEVDLAAELGVSRTVIRDALSEMERAGYVERVRGIGTVVNRTVLSLRSPLDQKLEYYPLIRSFGSYLYCMTGSFRIHYFPSVSRLINFFIQQVKNQFFTLCSRNRIDDEFYFFHSFVHAILVDCRRQK